MILSLVTPPTEAVVSTDALCDWLRITADDERALVESLEATAVAYLDGWGGILGRAIRQQVWRQEFNSWGTLRLALPDVSAIVVTALDANGDAITPSRAELRADVAGPYVITEGPATPDRVFVEMTCALPVTRLPVVQTAIRTMVAHWFMNREAVAGGVTEVPMSATALIDALRWNRM